MSKVSLQREYAATHLLPHRSHSPPQQPHPLHHIIPDYSLPAHLSYVPAYHTRQLYAHLLYSSSPSPSPHLPPKIPRPRLLSLTMQPYTLRPASLRGSGSYTEAVVNVATVPPPSPSPRKSLQQKSRAMGLESEWSGALPVLYRPVRSMSGSGRFKLASRAIGPSAGAYGAKKNPLMGERKGDGASAPAAGVPVMASSMPVRRPGAVPIQGILQTKPTRRSASKIQTFAQSSTSGHNMSHGHVEPLQPDGLSGSLKSLSISATLPPVPLLSPDVICPFLTAGSVIRPVRRLNGGSAALSSGTVSRERRVLRDLTNHAGLG